MTDGSGTLSRELAGGEQDRQRGTLLKPPSPTHGLAPRLLACAQGKLQKWPEGFVGFTASIRCRDGDREVSGVVRVFVGGRVEISLDAPGPQAWAEGALHAISRARTPRFFKDGDGRFPISFDPVDGHPLGRGVRVHLGTGAWRLYRIDPKGCLREEESTGPAGRVITIYDELVRTSPGRVIPTRMRVLDWDVATGAVRAAAEIEDVHRSLQHVVLPVRRLTTAMVDGATRTFSLELTEHRIL
jgi:hypothetical protein